MRKAAQSLLKEVCYIGNIRKKLFWCGGFLLLFLCLSACSSNKQGEPVSLIDAPVQSEEEMLLSAMDAYDSELFSRAREEWTTMRDGYPGSYFAPLAQLKIADSYYASHEYVEAIGAYQEFLRLYSSSEAAPYVKYRMALSYLNQYRGVAHDQAPLKEALKAFQETYKAFPSSAFGLSSGKHIVQCQRMLREYDLHVSGFYAKQSMEKAAIHREKLSKEVSLQAN
jgi:outer membrane protein assembly factor BamD